MNTIMSTVSRTIGVEGCLQQNKISVFKQREKVLPLDGVEGMPVGHLIVINVIRA